MSIVLPYRARSAYRRAFGIVLGVALSSAAGALLWWLAAPYWSVGLLIVAAAFVVVVMVDGAALELLYKAWNKAGRELAKLTRSATLRVAYFIVINAARVGEPRDDGASSGVFGWRPYGQRVAVGGKSGVLPLRAAGWRARYSEWTRWKGRGWATSLLPFLWILSYLGDEMARPEFTHDIYTLY